MYFGIRSSRYFALVVSCLAFIAWNSTTRADGPAGHVDEPFVGCGKAHALARHFVAEEDALGAQLTREAAGDTDVLQYDLDIEVSNLNTASNTCTITGRSVMTIKSLSPSLTQFTFRLRNQYTITSATVTDGNGTRSVTISTPSTTTRVASLAPATYGVNDVFTLTIDYTGASVSRGFGSIDVGTQGGTPVVATLSEAYYAYTWWPCKDGDVGEPGDNGDKAIVNFWLTAPNNYVVPSNGSLQGVDTLSGSRKRYRWASNYPIATYLVSFAATNYNTWTQTYAYPGGSMPVEFYIYPGNDTPSNRTAWGRCVDMLAIFRPFYGEYPFINEKYGIYNFNFGGGMEHQTMTGQGTFAESVTAHELAHQWWGDMVTCRTWRDIWLNEGFATFSECLWEEYKSGSQNQSAYFAAINSRKPSTYNDSVYCYNTADMNRIFSSNFSYRKAAWVLHMLRHVVGNVTFFNILNDYRNLHEYSAATTDDFIAVAETTSGRDLSTFFDQWVYNMGAPTYQYAWATTNVSGQDYLLARITQTHSSTSGSPPQIPNVFVMPVDLRVTIGGVQSNITVQNDARTEWFVVPTSGPVTALLFDPSPWILRSGATLVSYSPGPPKIIQSYPTPGASLQSAALGTQLSVTFHTPIDAAAGAFTLVGDSTGAHAVSIVSGANVNPVLLDLAEPLPPDTYTLTAVASNVTANNSGQTLDGEMTDPTSPASYPSGDGVAGGDAQIRFTLVPTIGDIDADGDVDDDDRLLLIDILLATQSFDPQMLQRADIDGSGGPDGRDIQEFVEVYPGF
ncbi:MAG: hypothetical protein L6Q92_03900 [Phycisphaerae bacterium]|nr:hypothetical protein [Phycisphaerae bacterium]